MSAARRAPRRGMPLRARLALSFTAVTTVVVVLVAALVQVLVGRALVAEVDDQLDAQALTIAAELAGEADTSEVVEELADLRLPPGRGVQVVAPDGRVVAARGEDARASRVDGPTLRGVLDGRRARGTVTGREPRRLVARGAGTVVVVVTESLAEVDATRRTLLGILVPVGVAAALAAGGLGWLAAGRGLAPLRRIARRAAEVDADRLATRLPEPGTRDEVGTLASALNAMLDRLGGAIDRERRFTADASHELRTPLAILRGEVELARAHVDGRVGERLDSALEEADRLGGLIDDLLVLARADADALDRDVEVDLAALARRTVERFATLAGRAEVTVRVTGAATTRGDPRGLDRALSNLVDNAVRHTPAGGTVDVEVTAGTDGARLTVRDSGPGVADGALPGLFDRFSRPDDARTSGGAGLGLAIVAAVVARHDGHVEARNRDEGGLAVTITLPRRAAPARRA